jgi:hypothetical protein
MAKQTINLGTADKGNGDPLRTAFNKVNENFTELYTALGLDSGGLNIGSFEFTDNTITTTDSTNIIIDQAVVMTSELEVGGDIVPNVANQHTLGTPAKPFKSLYVSNSTVYLGGTPLSLDPNTNELKINNVPVSQTLTYTDIPNVPTDVSDLTDTEGLLGGGGIEGVEIIQDVDTTVLTKRSEDTITEGEASQTTITESQIEIDPTNIVITKKITEISNDGVITATDVAGSSLEVSDSGAFVKQYVEPSGPSNSSYFQIRANNGAVLEGVQEQLAGNDYGRVTATQGIVAVNTAAGGIDKEWVFDSDGNLTLPAEGDILDSNGDSVLGGAAGPVQPYLELTDTPFITRPAVLGTPVTVTVPLSGINAQVQVDILEGPVLGGITVSQAGSGYIPGTTYKIYNYQIGGPTDSSSITFTIGTVDGNGGILTVANAEFVGVPENNTGSYGSVSIDYQPEQIFDEIRPGLTLTRDNVQGIYNSAVEPEYDNSTYLSPLGTEWNSDGWGDLTGIGTRSYVTWRQALNNQVGNNIVASELVMHDIVNDKYYKFDFTAWGGNNGGYSYTRTEVTDPNYFRKEDYATANNVDVIEDDSTIQIGITRGENNGIYNPFTEEGWNENVSPQGTEWNIDGWNDLSDVETRTYTNLYAAFGNGGLGNKIVGTECVMYVPSIEKYYAIKFLSWTQGNQGGGFSYTRKEIDLTKLNEGIKFQDGTILKSALGTGRVKSTAVGDRRIEEVTGYNQVSVTSRTTNSLTTVASRLGSGTSTIWVDITSTTIDEVLDNPANYNNAYNFQFSLDNTTWYTWNGSTSFSGDERGYGVSTALTYNQGDTIYFRYNTGAEPVVWWDKADLPGSGNNFRGAVIDYHAYTGESTIIGTIHIVDDSGEEHISHQEVQSGTTDGENDELWLVQNEGTISYRRIDGESKTLKVHWTAKVFYGSEFYD